MPRTSKFRTWLTALSLITVFAGSGCSYLFVDGPKPSRYQESSDCTTSNGWPVFDLLYGTLNTVANIALANKGGPNQGAYVGGAVGSAILWYSSSIYGFTKTKECRDAQEEDPEPLPRRSPPRMLPAPGQQPYRPQPAPLPQGGQGGSQPSAQPPATEPAQPPPSVFN